MSASAAFLIAGGGLAAAKTAEALRDQGFDGRILLVGDERDLPYERPPLSKGYLQGKTGRQKFVVHDDAWYRDHDIELRSGTAVTGIDRSGHQVTLSGGERIGYDKLLLATGASPRRLTVPGADLDGVLYLRTVRDSERIRDTLAAVSRVAIIGAGWIGLEVAAAARAAGVRVSVLEVERQPLLRVLGSRIASVFADLHRDHDVDLRLGTQVSEITGEHGKVRGVRLADGTHLEADAVVVGIGATPNTELAAAAGLEVEDGVRVGADLRTSDPDIFAAGDVANAYHPLLDTHIRVEHWANALNQPAVAARAMLGRDASYDRLPYFYTDQYDLGMEYTGHTPPGHNNDVVVRGDLGSREFIAFWIDDGRVTAGMNVNVWDVTDQIQALIRSGGPVDRDRLADPGVPLHEVTAG
ncbi:3-phenylpropionate/trans-cinnamate dioxygenase ferredoxin reductase subunit [Streptosporangium lutulentum]|uniref:3-phenylpropionate/trans-cinnamate dioxygenase ferredoxin reductase subunit n=2 Tax=Streptosporangium lutulentum TaxID=1461250 RepID=A0ABT9Q6S9_9ACTN|nr:FAD-dependent oxidoreductase [Streptosporangium lutulentum]MDP9842462.1 3-phenylpropionate/trans-cinnamate dioxygenase ferredoxin reductase subunit [Streptosporangium lutulentum]